MPLPWLPEHLLGVPSVEGVGCFSPGLAGKMDLGTERASLAQLLTPGRVEGVSAQEQRA